MLKNTVSIVVYTVDAVFNRTNRLLMHRLFFLILVFFFGSGEVVANDGQGERSQTQLFIELDRNQSLTTLNLILDNQDNSIIKKPSVPRVSNYADYYQQTTLFLGLKIDGSDSIRGPPLSYCLV